MANSSLCKLPGCDKRFYARDMCASHYARWRVHGAAMDRSPIVNIVGEPEAFIREAASSETKDCILWPYARNRGGYARIHRKCGTTLVSRIVCELVWGPPKTKRLVAAHSCGKGHLGCINPHHLSWKTHKENSEDAARHGTRIRGERVSCAKLTEHDVRQIRRLSGKMTQTAIAAMFDIDQPRVSYIVRRKDWSWLK